MDAQLPGLELDDDDVLEKPSFSLTFVPNDFLPLLLLLLLDLTKFIFRFRKLLLTKIFSS